MPMLTDDEFRDAFRTDVAELVVLPTEACNFRCTYCYEDFARGAMSAATVNAVLRFVAARVPGLSSFALGWFGGEPLLATDTVLRVSRAALQACAQVGADFAGRMTTNGSLLTPAVLADLVAAGITSYQISLDGPEEVHDRTRVRRSGRGSFARIVAALDDIRASRHDVTVVLRLHVTADNHPFLPGFVDTLAARYLVDPRFRLHLFPVDRLGGPHDGSFDVLAPAEALRLIGELYARLPAIDAEPVCTTEYVCYAARPHSLVVRSDGRLAKCTVALDDPRNLLGWLRPDGTVDIDDERHRRWLAGWFGADRAALRCPLAAVP